MSNTLNAPVLLTKEHDLSIFDCGKNALNDYLLKFALTNTQNNSSKCYVAIKDSTVIGYYCLSASSVEKEAVTKRMSAGLANHPIPLVLITRLAVDKKEHGRGIGRSLLIDALSRAIQVSDIVGIRGILVHAKDQEAKDFYLKYSFEVSPIDEFHLYLLIKDIKKTLNI
jgi:GNAT superfamily N-acetyltransferase